MREGVKCRDAGLQLGVHVCPSIFTYTARAVCNTICKSSHVHRLRFWVCLLKVGLDVDTLGAMYAEFNIY